MEIHYHYRPRVDPAPERGVIFHETLAKMLLLCGILSLNRPTTPEAPGLLNAERIACGAPVGDDALIGAPKSGKLQSVGRDVYNNEPMIGPRYREQDNVFLPPGQAAPHARHTTPRAFGRSIYWTQSRSAATGWHGPMAGPPAQASAW